FAQLLFWINIPAYAVLWLLYGARAVFFSRQFIADWCSHKRAFGFFTMVAATNVLGSQFFTLAENPTIAGALWWCGFILWGLCSYSIFVILAVQREKPVLADGINGGWLIARSEER